MGSEAILIAAAVLSAFFFVAFVLWLTNREAVVGGHYTDFEGIKSAAKLIKTCDTHIKIRAGELSHDAWSDESIISALEAAVKKGSMVRILFGPDYDVKNIQYIGRFYNKNITYRLVENRKMPHYTIIGKKHLHIEGPHEPLQKSGRYSIITRSRRDVEKFNSIFDKQWNDAGDDFDLVNHIRHYQDIKAGKPVAGFNAREKFTLIARSEDGTGTRPASDKEIRELQRAVIPAA